MEKKNIFYLLKDVRKTSLSTTSYNIQDGSEQTIADTYGFPGIVTLDENSNSEIYNAVVVPASDLQYYNIEVLCFGSNNSYLGYRADTYRYSHGKQVIKLISGTKYVRINFNTPGVDYLTTRLWFYVGYEINPHYKQIKKKYKKETDQMFFRESLDGKINLFGLDYLLVKNASLEDTLHFNIYKNDILFASSSFNKSDCKFDHFRKSVELKLTYHDKYSKILDAYDSTYDLIKLAPALTPLTLTKRCVAQIYIQGENVISNYAGGTYWETEVNEVIDSEEDLLRKYYFAKGPKFIEVSLEGFNYDINAVYTGVWDSNIWNATSVREVAGVKYKMPCSIKFTKVASAGDVVSGSINIPYLSTGEGQAVTQGERFYFYKYDTYRIEIYTGRDGTGTKIYQSDYLYGKDTDFTLAVGEGLYPMTKIDQPTPAKDPTPNTFNLGENVIEYQIWGRLLCDSDKVLGPEQEYIDTYDLPRDDFATARRNYRKCIGITGFDSPNSVIKIYQQYQTSESPTSYGINDFGEYFIPPYSLYGQYYFPLSRSAWGNTSLWVMLDELFAPNFGFEHWCSSSYKEYTIKECYHIGDAIKALLAKIDPTITHEKTAEYSSFLYGHSGASAYYLGGCDVFITQKTNVLKGEYDQAAQKAEIKFKQLMDMLRDCYRCYWFIDEYNRFRIEHISFFINGQSYGSPIAQFDLTQKKDKFNKKPALYDQRDIEYDKADLTSRYEFAWADDTTKAMGGDLYINVNNEYIQKDKTEEINVDGFTADIDYMLFLPDDFSEEGFALIMADSLTKKVPIVHTTIKDEKQYNNSVDIYTQNWYASFNYLVQHYMYDISGNNIECNNINNLEVENVKRCMTHSIEFPELEIDLYKQITTVFGDGTIEDVSINIDTDMEEVQLSYEPS